MIAAESVHPVPCVCGVSIRSASSHSSRSPSTNRSVARSSVEMAALHEDRAGPERQDRRRGAPHVVTGLHLEPREPGRLGQVGGDERRERQDRSPEGVHRVVGQQRMPVLRDEDGVDHDVRELRFRGRLRDGLHDRGRGEHPGLRGVDTDVAGDGRICSATVAGASSSKPATPLVFWTVTAVIAVMPNTPSALNVLRSAWIPAPPPESDPAIVSARGRERSARRPRSIGHRK